MCSPVHISGRVICREIIAIRIDKLLTWPLPAADVVVEGW
jgi:hypothetical protein